MANNETKLGALNLGAVSVEGAEEARGTVDVAFAVRNVPPHELASPAISGVVGHATTLTGPRKRSEDFHHVLVIDNGVRVLRVLILCADVPHHSARSIARSVRIATNPCASNEVVARGKFYSVELEPAKDAVEARGREHRVGVASRAHVSVTEIVTHIRVLLLEVVERETLADKGVNRGGLVNALVRVE